MKLSIALMFASALVLSACSRPVIKETVVERPVPAPATVVERPVVIERPAAAGASLPSSCTYASQSYSHGALSCQDRTEFKCNNGSWTRTFTAC
jgi:hypothetical protein